MNQLRSSKRRRLPSRFLLAVVGLVQLSCFSEPAEPTPSMGAGAEGGSGATDGAAAGAGGEESSGAAEPATFGLLHGTVSRAEVTWRLSLDGSSVGEGELTFRGVERLTELTPGSYRLELTSDGEQLEEELELTPGSELNVVVTEDANDQEGWQTHVLSIEPPTTEGASSDAPAARLFVIHAAQAGRQTLDIGNDGTTDSELEANESTSPQVLDVTRPALALLDDTTVTATFTLPQPEKDSSVVAILLGDPLADGLAPSGERLVVARMNADDEASEVLPDPVLYFLHASGVHAGLDLFIGRGNPVKATISAVGSVDVAAFSPDTSVNQRRVLAEVVDNARFGELRIGRVPPSEATLELYLTIPSDPQVPAGLNYNLVGDLLPNQRLRNGPAIGRQGGQTVDGELLAGAEYLLVAPSFGLFASNHLAAGAPKAPLFPFERLTRKAPPAGQFSLQVAASVKVASTTQTTTIEVDGTSALDASPRYRPTDPQLLEAGVHQLTASVGEAISGSLALEAEEGQELLVVLAGDAAPAPVVAPSAQRPDDTDGDGAVCSALDPETARFVDPNYLPPDGNSQLIQDDCPDAPGSLAHQGCPASPLTWLIIDLSKRPPTLRAVPLSE